MKKILLPTDFSDNSWNAIKFAIELFKDQNCNFILLNTYTPIIYRIEPLHTSSEQLSLLDSKKISSKEGLDTILLKIKSEFNNSKHTFSQVSSFNTLVAEIDELQKGNAMDIVVMGTQGATGAKEILFGSNAVHVIKNTKCPVLTIPSGFSFESPREILFPTDYDIEYQTKHLNPIIDIAQSHTSRVNILHVSSGNGLTNIQEKNKLILENSLKKIAHLFHDVAYQNIQSAIDAFQIKTKTNLLIMINNKHSFFENLFFKSTINQIGFHLNIPFLVIPSKV